MLVKIKRKRGITCKTPKLREPKEYYKNGTKTRTKK